MKRLRLFLIERRIGFAMARVWLAICDNDPDELRRANDLACLLIDRRSQIKGAA